MPREKKKDLITHRVSQRNPVTLGRSWSAWNGCPDAEEQKCWFSASVYSPAVGESGFAVAVVRRRVWRNVAPPVVGCRSRLDRGRGAACGWLRAAESLRMTRSFAGYRCTASWQRSDFGLMLRYCEAALCKGRGNMREPDSAQLVLVTRSEYKS